MPQAGSELAHRLLRLLIAEPALALDEVGARLGAARDEVEDALRWLADSGLILAGGQRRGASPVMLPPEALLARLIELEEEGLRDRATELERGRATLAVLSSVLTRLQAGVAAASGGEAQVRLITGEREVVAALEGAATRVRHEILSMHPGSPMSAETLAESMKRNRQVLERGVAMRSIHLKAMQRVPFGREHLRSLQDAGASVRVAVVLPFRLIVIDRAVAYTSAEVVGGQDGTGKGRPAALEVMRPEVVRLLIQTFEYCWVHGSSEALTEPLSDVPEADQLLDKRERLVLRMLSQGFKDDAIARSLGVSSRTFRRLMSHVMERLGATSRFQAGVRAMERGWLDG